MFDDEITRSTEHGDRETAPEIAEGDHSLLRFYLLPEARWGVISGFQSYNWPPDEKGEGTKPKDIGEHLTKAVRAVVKQNPCQWALSTWSILPPSATHRRARHQSATQRHRDLSMHATDLALLTCSWTFSAEPTNTCCGNSRRSGQSAGEFFTPTGKWDHGVHHASSPCRRLP